VTRHRDKKPVSVGTETLVHIPVLVNVRPLAAGEELFWFRVPPPKRSRQTAVNVASLMSAAKKAKV
jgi:hypothetical protein